MQCSGQIRRRLHIFRSLRTSTAPLLASSSACLRIKSEDGLQGTKLRDGKRCFSLSSIPAVLLPPVVFTGLLITLWTYKCMMMVIFQNKIIYMPSMPPFSRSEKVEDYENECKPVHWKEHFIRSLDGTKLAVLEGAVSRPDGSRKVRKNIIIAYFQGNGSSLPPRLPYLSNILKQLQKSESDAQYRLLALSYRGFWKSSGRPSQWGIELDAQAMLNWIAERSEHLPNAKVVLWGQSIGAGVATTALATRLGSRDVRNAINSTHIAGLLLETPFTSLNAMLISLYPQKFLPYRYLGPFLKSTWNSEEAFVKIGEALSQPNFMEDSAKHAKLRVMLLEAGDDELVPEGDAAKLLAVCRSYDSIEAEHKVVSGALHTNVMMKHGGRKEIVRFLHSFS